MDGLTEKACFFIGLALGIILTGASMRDWYKWQIDDLKQKLNEKESGIKSYLETRKDKDMEVLQKLVK